MVSKFLCVFLRSSRRRNSNRGRSSFHQQPSDETAAHHTPCDKPNKQRASVDQQQWRRLLLLSSWRACIKRRASVSSASSESEKAADGSSKGDACLSRSSLALSHDGKNSATLAPPIVLSSADSPPETLDRHTRNLRTRNAGATGTRPACRIRDDSMNIVGLQTTTTSTPASMAIFTTLPTSPQLQTPASEQPSSPTSCCSLTSSSLLSPSSFSSTTTAPSSFPFPSPLGTTYASSSEYPCADDNNHGFMQPIITSLDQRQGQLHEQHEGRRQRQMHMQQRMEHSKHEQQLQTAQQTRQQQYEHKHENGQQERREELGFVNTRTMVMFMDGDVGCGGTELAKGGKSMPIHAGLESVHLTTCCPSEAAQDAQEQSGHVSLLHQHSQLDQHAEQQQIKAGDAMWLSMTESVSHEVKKAVEGEGESENDNAHGARCSITSYMFDTPTAITPLSSSPPPRSSTSTMPSADTDYFERSATNGPKVLDPSIRFEMAGRLGYG